MVDVARSTSLPRRVDIVEVGPRDGLQNEQAVLATEAKIAFVEPGGGCRGPPDRGGQLRQPGPGPADGRRRGRAGRAAPVDGVTYIGLVLNRRGMDRAVAAGVDDVNVVVVATDDFGRAQPGPARSRHRSTPSPSVAARRPRTPARPSSATVSVAFGCPFEGEVAGRAGRRGRPAGRGRRRRRDRAGRHHRRRRAGRRATLRVEAVRRRRRSRLRCHFHNTRNTGYANAYRSSRGRRHRARRQHRRHRRLPVRPQRHRQHRHRGPRLHARPDGLRHAASTSTA